MTESEVQPFREAVKARGFTLNTDGGWREPYLCSERKFCPNAEIFVNVWAGYSRVMIGLRFDKECCDSSVIIFQTEDIGLFATILDSLIATMSLVERTEFARAIGA